MRQQQEQEQEQQRADVLPHSPHDGLRLVVCLLLDKTATVESSTCNELHLTQVGCNSPDGCTRRHPQEEQVRQQMILVCTLHHCHRIVAVKMHVSHYLLTH
jgi:hypothetical protein